MKKKKPLIDFLDKPPRVDFYIATFEMPNFSFQEFNPKRNNFLHFSTKLRRNPFRRGYYIELAKCYLKGEGTKKNLDNAKILFRKEHLRQNDQGTFGLLKCMFEQQLPFQSLYKVCVQRQDTQNGRILYKIGQGHIFHKFGNLSNYETGISFFGKINFKRI